MTKVTATPDPTHSPPRIALTVDSGRTTWAASTAYTVGQFAVPTAANGHQYKVTTAGTSGATQPTWPTGAGATVTDGTVTWIESGAPRASLTVYRIGQDGSQFQVRTSDDGPLQLNAGTVTLYDPEAPYGVPVSYTTSDPTTTVSATVTLVVDRVWLIHPNVPSLSMTVEIAAISDRSAAANQSVRYPLGRRFPIVASDGQRKSDTYTLTLRSTGADELDALNAILDDLSPLLLNVPADPAWIDLGTEYIAVGDLQRSNPAGFVQFARREWSLPCTVVGRPSGGSQAFNTYGYSKSLYATYADRKAAAATYGAAYNITN